MDLSFKQLIFTIIVIGSFSGCTKIFNSDRVLKIQFYDTQRAINKDIFIWVTYLNRVDSLDYNDGDYFIVGYYADKYDEELYSKLSKLKPQIFMAKQQSVKLTKLDKNNHLYTRLPYVSVHSVNYLVKFAKTTNTNKSISIKLGKYKQFFKINLDD